MKVTERTTVPTNKEECEERTPDDWTAGAWSCGRETMKAKKLKYQLVHFSAYKPKSEANR